MGSIVKVIQRYINEVGFFNLMAITEKQLAFIRDELDTAKRPLF